MKIDKRILIVGLGLLGGSIAKRLSSCGYEIYAISLDEKDIVKAKEDGAIIDGMTNVDADFVSSFDRLIFALYPDSFLTWIAEHGRNIKKGAIFTDVTGIKGDIVEKVQKMMDNRAEFISSHPMAGREGCGYSRADQCIFDGSNYLIVPTELNSPEGIAWCEQIGKDLGFAAIYKVSIREHDEMIALFSHLPHLLSVAFMDMEEADRGIEFGGGAYRDLTRIADINEDMWSELFIKNKEPLLKYIKEFSTRMEDLSNAIEKEDVAELKELLRLAKNRKRRN